MWFTSCEAGGEETRIELSMLVVERMKCQEERGGWVSGDEREVKVESRGVWRERYWVKKIWLFFVGGEVCGEESGQNIVVSIDL